MPRVRKLILASLLAIFASPATTFLLASPAIAGVVPGPTMGDNWSGVAAIVVVGVVLIGFRHLYRKLGAQGTSSALVWLSAAASGKHPE